MKMGGNDIEKQNRHNAQQNAERIICAREKSCVIEKEYGCIVEVMGDFPENHVGIAHKAGVYAYSKSAYCKTNKKRV